MTIPRKIIINRRYQILEMLAGSHAANSVHLVRDVLFSYLKTEFVMKKMRIPIIYTEQHETLVRVFKENTERLLLLRHDNIAEFLDYFHFFNDTYLVENTYVVMQHIKGHPLQKLLSKSKEIPVKLAKWWAIDICDALTYLHSRQPEPIILGDLNSFIVNERGKAVITIPSACIFRSTENMIQSENRYAAPECHKGNLLPQSDVYSVGAMLHHRLTRKDPRIEPPFSFDQQFNPKVPDAFVAIIEKALQFEPHNRWQSAAEMKSALESVKN